MVGHRVAMFLHSCAVAVWRWQRCADRFSAWLAWRPALRT